MHSNQDQPQKTGKSASCRVLHVTFDMRIGGTEQVIRNLIEACDPDKIQSSIFCIEEPLGPWGEQMQEQGTPIYCRARRPGFDFGLVLSLRRHLRQHAVDIVHCHQYTPWVYGALAAAGTSTRVVFTEHGRFYPDSTSAKRRFVNPLLAALTNHTTAISEATKQALVDFEYLKENTIEVVYNGIKPLTPSPEAATALRRELDIPAEAVIFGSIARFDPIKNHRMMLDAFRLIVDKHPQSRLLLVGDGEQREAIELQIEALELTNNVVLPGYIPQPAVWLEAMDVFLLSSFSEGTSMTLLEAMSLGKPCAVTDVGGNPEIIVNKETGFVTPNDQAPPFAAAAIRLIEEPDLKATMAAKAIERFTRLFTSNAMADSYTNTYIELSDR